MALFVIYGLPDTQDANTGKPYINLKLTFSSIQFYSLKVSRVHLHKNLLTLLQIEMLSTYP